MQDAILKFKSWKKATGTSSVLYMLTFDGPQICDGNGTVEDGQQRYSLANMNTFDSQAAQSERDPSEEISTHTQAVREELWSRAIWRWSAWDPR